MQNVVNQIAKGFSRMIEIVSWSDLLERAFRPLIKSNSLMVQPVRAGWFRSRED
jgi:hypothetical protein